MPSMVAGRFLQGVGGGGLVPATLALVADLYPAERRGVPLGIVSAVQELGSVVGPLFGAVVLAVADWRAIFADQPRRRPGAGGWRSGARRRPTPTRHRTAAPRTSAARDLRSGWRCCSLTLVAGAAGLASGRRRCCATSPGASCSSRSPATAAGSPRSALVAMVGRAAASSSAAAPPRRPLVDLRGWVRSAARGRPGRARCSSRVALAGVILAFATADPRGPGLLRRRAAGTSSASALAAVAFVLHLRRAAAPAGAAAARCAVRRPGARCWSASSSAPP